MYIATHKTAAAASAISEHNQSKQDSPSSQNSKAKLVKGKALSNQPLSVTADDTTTLTQSNLTRLLAACGDCV